MKTLGLTIALLCSLSHLFAQQSLLQSGPMLGYSEMREVLIWVQTKQSAEVKAAYWEIDSTQQVIGDTLFTETITTAAPTAYTAHLIANQVLPTKQYAYQILINHQALAFDYPTTFHTQPLWQWRKDAPDFTLAIGSCTYINETEFDRPGKPYGGDYQIFPSIAQQQPNMMIWLGDNAYLREVDWFTQTGIFHRYTHTRSIPELQALLANTHHYAIWDDHDFGPNNSDRSFVHKGKSLDAFQLFWGNPTYGVYGEKGITSQFQFHDIDFFLLDNRYHRTPNNRKKGTKTILGTQQLEWLIDALVSSKAPFKMIAIGGQVVNSAAVYETYATFPEERAYLLRRLEEENIKGVVFLTGDRHHTELSRYESGAGWVCYDLTVSPLTAGAARQNKELNRYRVEGTLVNERNFGLLHFGRTEDGLRQIRISVLDSDGEQLWEHQIDKHSF